MSQIPIRLIGWITPCLRASAWAIAIFALTILAPSCSRAPDAGQERTCRALIPALNASNSDIRILKTDDGRSVPGRVRIDYRVQEPGGVARVRLVICHFSIDGIEAPRGELIRLTTENGPVTGASLYFLRRFWLETPDSVLNTPSEPKSERALPASARSGYFLQQAISSLPMIAIYGLFATAYALIYGLIGRIVLTFGEFAALGGTATMIGIAAGTAIGVPSTAALFALAFAVVAWVALTWGGVAARLVLQPLARRPGQHILIATIGMSVALSELLRLAQGNSVRWLPPVWNRMIPIADAGSFSVTTTPMALAVTGIAFFASGLLVLVMRYSAFGRHWRACADDPLAAALFGVNAVGVLVKSFVLAAFIAGLGGLLIAAHYGGLGFAGGTVLGLKALVGAVVGGIGSVGGALVGGLLIGLGEALWSATLPIEWRDIAIFSALAVVLVLFPGGLFGYRELVPRRV